MQFKNLDEKKDQTDLLLFLTLLTNFPILKINWKRTADAQLISAAALILFSVSSGALFFSIQLSSLVLYRAFSAGLEKKNEYQVQEAENIMSSGRDLIALIITLIWESFNEGLKTS